MRKIGTAILVGGLFLFAVLVGRSLGQAQQEPWLFNGDHIFNSNSGNVGIGTDTPTTALHVVRANGTAKIQVEENSPTVAARELFKLVNNGGPFFVFTDRSLSKSWALASLANNDFAINQQQNPGIEYRFTGTGDLTIAGTITTKEVVVTATAGPDYVFAEDHRLRSLEELEAEIATKGRLPGIPSAEEMAANGVNVAEMQMKLLEKIEELTLYAIQLKKETDELRKRLESLESRQ